MGIFFVWEIFVVFCLVFCLVGFLLFCFVFKCLVWWFLLKFFLPQPSSTLLPPFAVLAPQTLRVAPELNKAVPVFVREAGIQDLHPAPLTVLSAATADTEHVVCRTAARAHQPHSPCSSLCSQPLSSGLDYN